MQNKPEIVFTFPACMGGVCSFNYNIINYGNLKSRFFVKVIMIKEANDIRPDFLDKFDADEVILFKYSESENQYWVQQRLNDLLGNSDGAIVTDNGITIIAARRFDNPKTVFQLIHDYYYVNLNVKLANFVDVVIAHSSFFSDVVFSANPLLFVERNFYIPYGVKQLDNFPVKSQNKPLNLVFLGRLEENKGVLLLSKIDDLLISNGVYVNWSIIGKGPLKKSLLQNWSNNTRISFYEPESTEDVYRLLKNQDIFVFPTSFEGTPVSILECLSNGVVTITNNLPGGIRDIVKEDVGFCCELNNLQSFVGFILKLNSDRSLLKDMQLNCFERANQFYNVLINANEYALVFSKWKILTRKDKHIPNALVKLDRPIIPNVLVKLIRNIKH